MEAKKVVKTTVNLPPDALEAISVLASNRGSTMAEVIRQAIATEKFLFDTTKAGGKILIEDKDENMKQVVLR
jgi:predicted transcriptional regulator